MTMAAMVAWFAALAMLERRHVITTDRGEADRCCGLPRDTDGFCQHRPSHPIFVNVIAVPA